MAKLFSPLKLGGHILSHRVIMAPLTRMRAVAPAYAPTDLMVEYYGQRASDGGLIITEATQISETARGGPDTPGIYTAEQVNGWQRVTQAIHGKGGITFMQLWHMGRISHSSYQPDGGAPWAPSAIAPQLEVTLPDRTRAPAETPRAFSTEEIGRLIESYVAAGKNAVAAGFDGVEIHAANGYLLEQFLQSRTNQRTDRYGGSIENRCRVVIESADALAKACDGGGEGEGSGTEQVLCRCRVLQRRWRQVDSTTSAAAWRRRGGAAAAHSATAAARWQQRGGCGGGGSATARRWWQRHRPRMRRCTHL